MPETPAVDDFTVKRSIDGVEGSVPFTNVTLDSTATVVTLTVDPVVATAVDQSVVYSVSYKGEPAVKTAPIIISLAASETAAKAAVEMVEAAVVVLTTQQHITDANSLVAPAQAAIAVLPIGDALATTLTTRVNNALASITKAQAVITATEAVTKAEESLLEVDATAANALVTELPSSDVKTLLTARVGSVDTAITAIITTVNAAADAGNQIALNTLLAAKPLVNYDIARIASLVTSISTGNPTTLADIQGLIDAANTSAADSALTLLVTAAQTAMTNASANPDGSSSDATPVKLIDLAQTAIDKLPETLTETVATAKGVTVDYKAMAQIALNGLEAVVPVIHSATQFDLLAALQNPTFVRVNPNWIVDYAGATGFNLSTPATVLNTLTTPGSIQLIIDSIDNTKISDAQAAVTTVAHQTAVTQLIQDYSIDDVTPGHAKADAIKASQLVTAILANKEASTEDSVYNALLALTALDSTIKSTDLNINLKADYLTAQAVYKGSITTSTTPGDIQLNLVYAADSATTGAAISIIDALTSASTAVEVKTALQTLANVTSHLTGASKFEMNDVVDAYLLDYVSVASVGFGPATIDTIANVSTAISTVNNSAESIANLAKISNVTSSVAQVRVALLELALANPNPDTNAYANASTQAQLETAQFVMTNRSSLTAPLTVASVVTDSSSPTYADNAIAKASLDLSDSLLKFNAIGDLGSITTPTAIQTKTALDTYAYAPYVALSSTDKLEVAKLINGLTKLVDSTVTPLNFTGSDAVTTMKQANAYIDAAIAALTTN